MAYEPLPKAFGAPEGSAPRCSEAHLRIRMKRRRLIWYYGWNVAAVAILFQVVVSGVAITSFSLWVSSWTQAFHAERAPVLSAMTLTLIISGTLSPTVGSLLDRRPIRTMVTFGLLCFAAGFFLLSVSTALWQIIAVYGVLMGISTTLCGSIVAQTLMTKWFLARTGLAIGIALTGLSLGGVVMPPLLAFLLSAIGWRSAAAVIAGIGLALIPLVLLVIRNSPGDLGLDPEREAIIAEAAPRSNPEFVSAGKLLLHPNFWPMVVTFVPLFTALKAMGANFGPITSDLGISTATAAIFLSVNNVCTIIGKIVIGRIADRSDARLILLLFVLITSAGFMLMLGHPPSTRVLLATVLLGAGSACLYPMQGILIRRYFGVIGFGRVLGTLNVFFLLSAFGGQVAGAVRDRVGNYNFFLLACAIAPLLLGLTVLRLKRYDQIERRAWS